MYDAELLERIRFLKKEYKKQNINAEEFMDAVEEELEDYDETEDFMQNIIRFVDSEEKRREDEDLRDFLEDFESVYEEPDDPDWDEDF